MKKIVLSMTMAVSVLMISAQSPTIVTVAPNCTVSHNFNNSSEGFSSPSIYSDANDVSFNWNSTAGTEVESSGLILRTGSLISPVFIMSGSGTAIVGFTYSAPAGTQYRLRIISSVSSNPLEVLATTANGPVYTTLTGTSGTVCLLLTDADLTSGKLIRYEFTFRALLPGNIVFDNLAIGVAGAALPVTFEGFAARQNMDGTVKLLWNVGEEVNVAGYNVESSTNGVNFKNAGYVPATGMTIYGLDFPEKQLQTMYYRIKNVDFDGKSKYSTIIRVYTKEQTGGKIQLYPLPATDMVTVQHSRSAENAVITVFSQEGKLLQQIHPVINTLQTQFSTGNLAKGVYIVRVDDGQGNTQSIKMLKN